MALKNKSPNKGLYKVGKYWVYANIATLGLGLALMSTTNQVNAETTSNESGETAKVVTESNASVAGTSDKSETGSDTPADTKPADVNSGYEAANEQVDESNQKADEANDSGAKLEDLVNDKDLTKQPDWQETVKNAIDDYKDKTEAFTETNVDTDKVVNDYQEIVDKTIENKPNVVQTVTDNNGDEQTDATISTYDQAVSDYKQQISDQLTKVQKNLDTFNDSEVVNQKNIGLTDAAKALNEGLSNNLSNEKLTELKDNYDLALTEFNTAVTDYNSKNVTDNPLVEQSVNPTDDTFKNILDYNDTYNAANQAYKDTVTKSTTVHNDITDWKFKVDKYNAALTEINKASDTVALDETDLTDTALAVSNAKDAVKTAQDSYDAVFLSGDTDKIMNSGAQVAEDLAKATNDLKAKVDAWNLAQADYRTALESNGEGQVSVQPNLSELKNSVNKAQTTINGHLDELKTSQATYQNTLDDYQAILTKLGSDQVVTDVPDLADFEKHLSEVFQKNNDLMGKAEKFQAVKNAEAGLQQKIDKINGYAFAINNNQAVWNDITSAAISSNTGGISQWTKLTDVFRTVGENFKDLSARYGLAINGNVESDVPSYESLVDIYQTNLSDYDGNTGNYTSVDELVASYNQFSQKLTDFSESFQNMIDELDKNAPNQEFNEKTVNNMTDMTSLSTTGDKTASVESREGGNTINVFSYFGDNLDFFLNNTALRLNWVLKPPSIQIKYDDKIFTDSKGNVIPNTDADGNPLASYDNEQSQYTRISDSKRIEMEDLLRSDFLPTFTKNDVTYQLTSVFVPGQVNSSKNLPEELEDYYVFTSADPISEFMDMFIGIGTNDTSNTMFKFYYTANTPGIVSEVVADSVTGDLKEQATVEIPGVEDIKDLTKSDLAKLSQVDDSTILPTTTKVEKTDIVQTMGNYAAGYNIENDFDEISLDKAPKITLNQFETPGSSGESNESGGSTSSTNPNDESESTDPEESTDTEKPIGPTDPANPEEPSNPTNNGESDDTKNSNNTTDSEESNDSADTLTSDISTTNNHVNELNYNSKVSTKLSNLSYTSKKDESNVIPQLGDGDDKSILQMIGISLLALLGLFGINVKSKFQG